MTDELKARDYFFPVSELDHDEAQKAATKAQMVAITAVMCEMAHVDDNFAPEEFDAIIRVIVHQFHLMDDEGEELREIATLLTRDKAKVDEFLDQINAHFDLHQRKKVYELAIQVAQADGYIDQFEVFFAKYLIDRLGLNETPPIKGPIKH